MDVLIKIAACLIILSSCSTSESTGDAETAARAEIVVTNAPLYYFVSRLAPTNATVHFPMADAPDPAYWEISTDTVAMMQQADMIIMNGAEYETWAAKVTLPASKITNSIGDDVALIPIENGITHSHGAEGEHAHKGTAFTTWLDFDIASRQAGNIANALKEKFPEYSSSIDERLSSLTNELNFLNQEMHEAADTSGYYVFSHPVYQYFQRAYHIKGESLHWEPDALLETDQLHDLEHIMDHHTVSALVWENTPLPENLQKLDSMGIKSIVVSPAGAWENGYDFIRIMETNIQNFRQTPEM